MNFATLTKVLFTITILLFSLSVSAQKDETTKLDSQVVTDLNLTPKMALGLQKERHIKGAFNFFDQLIKSDVEFENFEIIIWSKVVENLKEGSELYRLIEENQHPKLRVSVCEGAMKRLGVIKEDLPEGATPVPNAFLRLLQVQAKGYNTVTP
ncbi:MAG TPA: hypothetical protein VFM70_07025 [Salinimicrobium sp.]|nr:hypothetical protein [Salinimicrobium sp.]